MYELKVVVVVVVVVVMVVVVTVVAWCWWWLGAGGRVLHHPSSLCFLFSQILNPQSSILSAPQCTSGTSVLKFLVLN